MIVKIADEIYQQYQSAAAASGTPLTAEQLVERQLLRFAPYPLTSRVLVLHGDILEQVDRLFGPGSTKDPQTFLTRAHEYAAIVIGNIRLDFSPAQKAEIAHRASRQGKTPREVTEGIVTQLTEQFFWEGTPTR